MKTTKLITKKALREARIAEVEGRLRELCPPGSTVYTVLRGNPSKSGMSRRIDLVVIEDGRPLYLTSNAAELGIAGMSMSESDWAKGNGARINGCGMDMGFHAVDCLAYRLYGDGKALRHRWI